MIEYINILKMCYDCVYMRYRYMKSLIRDTNAVERLLQGYGWSAIPPVRLFRPRGSAAVAACGGSAPAVGRGGEAGDSGEVAVLPGLAHAVVAGTIVGRGRGRPRAGGRVLTRLEVRRAQLPAGGPRQPHCVPVGPGAHAVPAGVRTGGSVTVRRHQFSQ